MSAVRQRPPGQEQRNKTPRTWEKRKGSPTGFYKGRQSNDGPRPSTKRTGDAARQQMPRSSLYFGATIAPYRPAWADHIPTGGALKLVAANPANPYTFDRPDLGHTLHAIQQAKTNQNPSPAVDVLPSSDTPEPTEAEAKIPDQQNPVFDALGSALSRRSAQLHGGNAKPASGSVTQDKMFGILSDFENSAPQPASTTQSPAISSIYPYYSFRPLATTRAAVPQKAQTSFVYLNFDPHAQLDQVLSGAGSVTDTPEHQAYWTPAPHWILAQRHHVSLSRLFKAHDREAPELIRELTALAASNDPPQLKLSGFESFHDANKYIAYLVTLVNPEYKAGLLNLSNQVQQVLSRSVTMPPQPYFSEHESYHMSVLAARIASSQSKDRQDPRIFFDRSLFALSNADLLLRRHPRLYDPQAKKEGMLPPPPGVADDQPQAIVQVAEAKSGEALRALPTLRPASLALRIGRKMYNFPFRKLAKL